MAQNSKHITIENMSVWMASTGFLFPRDEIELARFEKLYGEEVIDLTGSLIDPEIIIGRKPDAKIVKLNKTPEAERINEFYKMVARKGGNIPKHILDKMKNNQLKRKDDDTGSEKKSAE